MTDDDSTTTSTKTRWEHTGTFVVLLLTGTLCGVVALYAYKGTQVPIWVAGTFSILAIAGAAWTFGESAVRAARKAGSDG